MRARLGADARRRGGARRGDARDGRPDVWRGFWCVVAVASGDARREADGATGSTARDASGASDDGMPDDDASARGDAVRRDRAAGGRAHDPVLCFQDHEPGGDGRTHGVALCEQDAEARGRPAHLLAESLDPVDGLAVEPHGQVVALAHAGSPPGAESGERDLGREAGGGSSPPSGPSRGAPAKAMAFWIWSHAAA